MQEKIEKPEKYLETKRNFILLGESGCGKSETAIFLAKKFAEHTKKTIYLIDLDQTKGMYRSRDWRESIETGQIQVCCGAHFMDTPLVPHGMQHMLSDEKSIKILDVGGNETGAVTLGQFEKWINGEDSVVFYIVNPYRNFSGTKENLLMHMNRIMQMGRVEKIHILSNPNLGQKTEETDILQGHEILLRLLAGTEFVPEALLIPKWVSAAAFLHLNLPIYEIQPMIHFL